MNASPARPDRLAELVAALRRGVLDSEAATDRTTRAEAASGSATDPRLADYVRKVHEASYKLTDADIAALREQGFDEEEIFEVTIAAAVGAATRRLDAGLRAVRGGGVEA